MLSAAGCELFLPAHLGAALLLARQGKPPRAVLVVAAALHLLTAAQQYRAEGRILAQFDALLLPPRPAAAAAPASEPPSPPPLSRLSPKQLGWPISFARAGWWEQQGLVAVERAVPYGEAGALSTLSSECV
eukprot:SAG11_NODE_4285_length_1968_cov_2.485821_2_plen_131_part_00